MAFDFDGIGLGAEVIFECKIDLIGDNDNSEMIIDWTTSRMNTFETIFELALKESTTTACGDDDCDYLIPNVTYGYGYRNER